MQEVYGKPPNVYNVHFLLKAAKRIIYSFYITLYSIFNAVNVIVCVLVGGPWSNKKE